MLIMMALGSALVSCKKYLEELPETEFDVTKAFADNPNALKSLLGAYSYLAGDPGYGIRLSIYYPMGTDESMNPSENDDGGRRSISRYQVTPGNSELRNPFRQLYKGIEMANICIDNIPQMSTYASSAETKRMHGEALTLRAIYYFELIKNWGDVPGVFVPASKSTDNYPQKMDRDLIYDRLLADLKTAEDLVPWRTEVAADERFTKGGIKALRAKIALFRGGFSLRKSPVAMVRGSNYLDYYRIARDECKEIMDRPDQHALAPTMKGLFKNYVCGVKTPVDPYGEIMLQVAMAGGSGIADSKMGYACGPRVANKGNNFIIILPTAFYQFDSVDSRRDVSVAPYNVNADGVTKTSIRLGELRDGKFRRDWITPAISPNDNGQYFGVNWPLIRFSDVLLMYAEAVNEIEGAPTADAIAAFEKVRKRGYVGFESRIGVTPTSKTGFFDAIVKERLLEFMGEGIRKYDLIRWNLLGAKIAETRVNIQKMADGVAPYDNIPKYMYYYTAGPNAQADNFSIYANSLYNPGPTSTSAIPGATRVIWTQISNGPSSSTSDDILDLNGPLRFAPGFTPNKSELFPIHQQDITEGHLIQDYGY